MFPTYQRLQKRFGDFFFIVLILSYLQKSKRPDFYTLDCYIFINNSMCKQNKKIPGRAFVDIAE